MEDNLLCYRVGALLYSPADNQGIVESIVNEKFDRPYSLALCLEDTIRDDRIAQAEEQLIQSLQRLKMKSEEKHFYIPKLFIRVRKSRQIPALIEKSEEAARLIAGFILPKFSLENADDYIHEIVQLNDNSENTLYMMPIMESPAMIDLRTRYDMLYQLKDKLDQVKKLVLNIRVGGNDLCHAFGIRRRQTQSIYEIHPVFRILSDILTVFSMDYVVSGPVWEYYANDGWDTGLARELTHDRLNGFVGKTVIHPNQIALVNKAYQVSQKDYDDALSILNWSDDWKGLVAGSLPNGRMNEYKTHGNWAKKILILSEVYGISKDAAESGGRLL